MEKRENEGVIKRFLKKRSDFYLDVSDSLLPDEWVTSEGFMFSFPTKTNTDGLFAAKLQRKLKNSYKYYIFCTGLIILLLIVIADFLIMPVYVRHGQGSYMVNVKGKQLDYALDILHSEGHKGIVSDTFFLLLLSRVL